MLEQTDTSPPILLTPGACETARRLQSETPEYNGKSLRLYLAGKGCDGFEYGVSFDDALPTDHHFSCENIDLITDAETLPFVQGTTIDWVDDERGKGFLVENPRHKQFRGKFYKRPNWQERLNKFQPNSSES